jgi:isopropylmalate/homocitrate/citramalate synthase
MTNPAALPSRVRLVEVGPRDGLQNEAQPVPTEVKVALIDRLTEAGFPAIEATAFVSPKWVPQMADAAAVMARIRRRDGVRYPVLTPNLQGFEAAMAASADEVAVFVAASEAFSRRNINCTIAESLERAKPVFGAAAGRGVRVRAYISCVLGCPYEGDVDPRRVAELAAALHALGAYEVSLGDTIGVPLERGADPPVGERVPIGALAGHFTTPTDRRSPTSTLRQGRTFDCSSPGSAAVPTPGGRPATWRARTSSTC